jgi:hypothetical protein
VGIWAFAGTDLLRLEARVLGLIVMVSITIGISVLSTFLAEPSFLRA